MCWPLHGPLHGQKYLPPSSLSSIIKSPNLHNPHIRYLAEPIWHAVSDTSRSGAGAEAGKGVTSKKDLQKWHDFGMSWSGVTASKWMIPLGTWTTDLDMDNTPTTNMPKLHCTYYTRIAILFVSVFLLPFLLPLPGVKCRYHIRSDDSRQADAFVS